MSSFEMIVKVMKKTLFVIICLSLLYGCATQEDAIRLDNRLSMLETQSAGIEKRQKTLAETVEEIQGQLEQFGQVRKEEEQDLRSESASLHVKIDRLKEELRILNGNLEEVRYTVNKNLENVQETNRRLRETVSFHKDRLLQIERYLNLEPVSKAETKSLQPSPSKPPVEKTPEKELTETEIYTTSKQLFDQGEYEDAREGFEKLLKKHPKSPRADNAQFWIGETYYRERWYEKAILEYQQVIEKYPNGNKVAAALLKQGFAFLNLGDKPNARLILKELVKKYPNSNEANVARQKLTEF